MGIDVQVCPSCQQSDHGVCRLCHRSRLLLIDEFGRNVCRRCHEGGIKNCSDCSAPTPAGRGGQCESCYWSGLLAKRIAIGCEVFSSTHDSVWFRQFADWLSKRIGVHKAAITINRYISFFVDLAAMGEQMRDVDALLTRFTTLGLRRQQLPMQFLEAAGYVVVSRQEKESASDRRRIEKLVVQFSEGANATLRLLLEGYLDLLQAKLSAEKISLRSVRLAMTPAAAFLSMASKHQCAFPSQAVLQNYLGCFPGQRATLSGFVRYLREEQGIELHLPSKLKLSRSEERKDVGVRLARWLIEMGAARTLDRRALELALMYFHGIRQRQVREMVTRSTVALSSQGDWVMIYCGRSYWIPSEVLVLNELEGVQTSAPKF